MTISQETVLLEFLLFNLVNILSWSDIMTEILTMRMPGKGLTGFACIPDYYSLSPGKHTAPVWQIKWIEKERGSGDETAEVLVSISTDGRVCQWSIRKGFECYGMTRPSAV